MPRYVRVDSESYWFVEDPGRCWTSGLWPRRSGLEALEYDYPTAHGAGATPVPIPNTEVKPRIGDGTAGFPGGRVARRWDPLGAPEPCGGFRGVLPGRLGSQVWLPLLVALLAAAAGAGGPPAGGAGSLELRSPAFPPGSPIPRRYTCEGADRSPPLRWTRVPDGTRSFVLILDDPDAPDPRAPRAPWVHWVLFNLPPTVRELPEGVSRASLPSGARLGRNDWRR